MPSKKPRTGCGLDLRYSWREWNRFVHSFNPCYIHVFLQMTGCSYSMLWFLRWDVLIQNATTELLPDFSLAAKRNWRLYTRIRDNLNKIGIIDSKALATWHWFADCVSAPISLLLAKRIREVQCCNPRCSNRATKNRHAKLLKCARCQSVYYHGKTCQRKYVVSSCFLLRVWTTLVRDWTQHKRQCKCAQGLLWFDISLSSYVPLQLSI